jgi:hypothetical protein
MGKIDAILHMYAATFVAEKRTEQAKKGSSLSHLVPPVTHISVLRDTQRLWQAASAEHRAAFEVYAESKYCDGLYPHMSRWKSRSISQDHDYCTTILKIPDENNQIRECEDPSKRFALRLPRWKSTIYQDCSPNPSFDVTETENANEYDEESQSDNSDGFEERTEPPKSIGKKKSKEIKSRRLRMSKKQILLLSLQSQKNVLRALRICKKRSLPKTDSLQLRRRDQPIIEIDWARIPLPSSSLYNQENNYKQCKKTSPKQMIHNYSNEEDDDEEDENASNASASVGQRSSEDDDNINLL